MFSNDQLADLSEMTPSALYAVRALGREGTATGIVMGFGEDNGAAFQSEVAEEALALLSEFKDITLNEKTRLLSCKTREELLFVRADITKAAEERKEVKEKEAFALHAEDEILSELNHKFYMLWEEAKKAANEINDVVAELHKTDKDEDEKKAYKEFEDAKAKVEAVTPASKPEEHAAALEEYADATVAYGTIKQKKAIAEGRTEDADKAGDLVEMGKAQTTRSIGMRQTLDKRAERMAYLQSMEQGETPEEKKDKETPTVNIAQVEEAGPSIKKQAEQNTGAAEAKTSGWVMG